MNAGTKTLAFATVLGVCCSTLLVGVHELTDPFVRRNQRLAEVRLFLDALGVNVPANATSDELTALFDRSVEHIRRESFDYYVYRQDDDGPIACVAVTVAGQGVWGEIKGIVALAPDWITIRELRFIKQSETPGLGGEIASESFLTQFPGKKLVSDEGQVGFHIVPPGSAREANEVDGITGATMTSRRVGLMLDNLAKQIHRK
jgi:Na+-transporting NADH:ubiquinone oxidoreductase subunit C